MDFYQLLGVSRNCGRNELHRAFREASKKYHPDRFPETARQEAEKTYQKIVIAFNTLKDPRQRSRYDRKLQTTPQFSGNNPVEKGREAFKLGLGQYHHKDYEAGLVSFKAAVQFEDNPEYLFYLGLCMSQLAAYRKDAVKYLQTAVMRNPQVPKYHTELIRSLLEFGLVSRAKLVVEKALSLFPEHETLLDLARQIDPEKYRKGGILNSLFGRRKGAS